VTTKEPSIKQVLYSLVGAALFLTFALSLLTYLAMSVYFLMFNQVPEHLELVTTILGWSFIFVVMYAINEDF
jgi:Na+-driven multidrug efflux pump